MFSMSIMNDGKKVFHDHQPSATIKRPKFSGKKVNVNLAAMGPQERAVWENRIAFQNALMTAELK